METRIARCHCGALELACEGKPRKVSVCHCLDCQRRTGAAFSVAVFYERERVRLIQGAAQAYERPSAAGLPVVFSFCPGCGSNVFWEPQRMPELIGLALGAFADPEFPPPEQSVWTRDKHRWIALPEDMTAFELNPPPRAPAD